MDPTVLAMTNIIAWGWGIQMSSGSQYTDHKSSNSQTKDKKSINTEL